MTHTRLLIAPLFALLVSCGHEPLPQVDADADAQGHSAPTSVTIAANRAVAEQLPLDDPADFENARRGLIATPDALQVMGPEGELIWDMPAYAFIEGEAPGSVNPSLWRQAQLNNIHGLFEVTDGVYQLRGFDLANLTVIEGETGWILVDPLTTRETAAAGMDFIRKHLGDKPIRALIFTHSHIDHFGGALTILDSAPDDLRIIAPEGFMEEATSENVLAGTTMQRRATYMYGRSLAHSPRGHVDTGLGKGPAFGSPGIAAPTDIVTETGQRLTLDGVEFVFQNAPASEAPAELTFYLPQKKAFCGAELVSRNMHNIYTLRGTKVRDAAKWAAYIDEALNEFGIQADVYFASHHWPLWGNDEIVDFLKKQRDTYKFIHDQTLRLAAQGMTPGEIAETLTLPRSLQLSFPNRGYYGTTRHNAKAVYQAYFGWYDGNPANLNPLPPVEAAERYVGLMGGPEAVLAAARQSFDAGEYRWAAQLLNHLVFAAPDNIEARGLLANTYDQLGYQSESGPWRDVYLSGAYELRHGAPETGFALSSAADLLTATPVASFFDTMSVMLDGEAAEDVDLTLQINFPDLNEQHRLWIENAVLHHRPVQSGDAEPDASIRITHALFIAMLTGQAGLRDTLLSDDVAFEGSQLDLLRFFSLLQPGDGAFNIVTP